MARRTQPKASDNMALAKPYTTSPHLQRGRPAIIRTGGLHDIGATSVSAHGKVLISPVPNTSELAARRLSERLEVASRDVPVRNSTMRGEPYTCPELRANPPRPGSADAYRLPSRTSFNKG